MTKRFCDDCGDEITGEWRNGVQWLQPDMDLCCRCYDRRRSPQPIVWYPCASCGAEHGVPYCPFAAVIPLETR